MGMIVNKNMQILREIRVFWGHGYNVANNKKQIQQNSEFYALDVNETNKCGEKKYVFNL